MSERSKARKRIGDYFLEGELGRGECGVVYLAISALTDAKFAVKCLSKQQMNSNDIYRRLLSTEITIMNKINHPNIVHLHELMESGSNYYLVLDYCDKGDFRQFMQTRKLQRLDEGEAVHFLRQMMHGFQELRRHKIIHRDLKLANLLVSENTVKIADFGFAKRGRDVAKTIVGTYLTMAPELLVSSGESEYTSKSDLWSLGVVYYQILFGEPPYFGLTPNEIYQDIRRKSAGMRFPQGVSPASQNLLARLLRMDPEERIDWPEFFAHELFAAEGALSPQPTPRQEQRSRSPMLCYRNSPRDSSPVRGAGQVFNFKDIGLSGRSTNSVRVDCTTPQPPSPARLRARTADEDTLWGEPARTSPAREALQRYFHEKNKILFIVFSVRHLRKLTKQPCYREIAEPLFALCILLLRKAMLLTEQGLAAVRGGQNVFGLPGFEEFQRSGGPAAVVRAFDSDRPNFRNYLNYLLKTLRREGFQPALQSTLDGAEEAALPVEIDALIAAPIAAVRAGLPAFGEEARRALLVGLVAAEHSASCEARFPFVAGQETPEWTLFLAAQEQRSSKELLAALDG